jgi:peptidoglycan/xylan/chitin deacetylase (PgdA/CDA1 family)
MAGKGQYLRDFYHSLGSVAREFRDANAVFKKNMAAITEREYGDRVGIWRLMDLFNRYKLKVTFLMNGLKVEQFPNEVKEFKAQGHEFSSECYEHEYAFMYTKEQERESIQKTVAAFEKVLGQKPTGYLSPGHASTPNTLELVVDAGFVWWADPLNSDNPYTVEHKGKKVVVVPYNVPGCNDYSTYGAGRTPRDLLQIMKDQFDYLYWEGEQGAPKFFAFNCHPFVSGVPFRTKIIEEFIRYAQGFPKVWFARRIEIANWCLEKGY